LEIPEWAEIMEKIPDELGFILHDRSTRGEALTSEETQQLEAWYEVRDAAEAMLLKRSSVAAPDLVGLQCRLDAIIEELRVVRQRMQQISSKNLKLRREIADAKGKD
jgi:hypothetical protein